MGNGTGEDAGLVATEILLRESVTGFEEPRREVIRDEERWRATWAGAYAGRDPVPEPAAVAFEAHVVLLAAMGPRPTGGYEVRIPEVRHTEQGLLVTVLEVLPGEGCLVTQALTSPAVAVEAPAAEEVVWEVSEERRPC